MNAAATTASVAVLVAVANFWFTWHLSRSERRYERRRTALLEVQDAALDVRRLLRTYGSELAAGTTSHVASPAKPTHVVRAPQPAPLSSSEIDHADGRLDVCAVRLEDKPGSRTVGTALDSWRQAAREHFLSPEDEARGVEQQRWEALNLAVAAALAA